MASILKVDTLTGVATAGSIAVTGEGNSTTTNLQQGLAKAWVNFNGTGTIASRDSFNLSSLTDNGTGDTTVTISNAFANADFSTLCGRDSTLSQTRPKLLNMSRDTALSTTVSRYLSVEGTSSATVADEDCEFNFVAIHGDFA